MLVDECAKESRRRRVLEILTNQSTRVVRCMCAALLIYLEEAFNPPTCT